MKRECRAGSFTTIFTRIFKKRHYVRFLEARVAQQRQRLRRCEKLIAERNLAGNLWRELAIKFTRQWKNDGKHTCATCEGPCNCEYQGKIGACGLCQSCYDKLMAAQSKSRDLGMTLVLSHKLLRQTEAAPAVLPDAAPVMEEGVSRPKECQKSSDDPR